MSRVKKVLLGIATILAAVGLYLSGILDNDLNTNPTIADTTAKVKAGVTMVKEGINEGTTATTAK